jgi:hypothetical protein
VVDNEDVAREALTRPIDWKALGFTRPAPARAKANLHGMARSGPLFAHANPALYRPPEQDVGFLRLHSAE